jgi:hypothetical protein
MYRTVYNHRLNVVSTWLLRQVVRLARRLGPQRVWADATMAAWLWQPEALGIADYLANDDLRTGYHLLRWREEGPAELAHPCQRLLDRRLLQATDVSELAPARRLELLAEAQRLTRAAGLDPEGCCGLQQRQSLGYDPYRGGLRLWDGQRLQALEQRSPLVSSLTSRQEIAWLIHPSETTSALRLLLAEWLPVAGTSPSHA